MSKANTYFRNKWLAWQGEKNNPFVKWDIPNNDYYNNFSYRESLNLNWVNEQYKFDIELGKEPNPITKAIIDDDRYMFIKAIKQNPEKINLPDASGALPIHFAATHKTDFYTWRLIDSGSCINPSDKGNFTPLVVAVSCNNQSSVKALLKAQADPYLINNYRLDAFHIAYLKKYFSISDILHREMGHYDELDDVPITGEIS